jgi:4-aminobutyrate aminotransferase-like enzyme/Ser/Thr protein kinase RdoA (MazF antagonist)
MLGDVLETPPADITTAHAGDIARRLYGLDGAFTPLDGERDRTFRVDAAEASYVLKIGNPAEEPGIVEMQALALEHALAGDPTLPIPQLHRTVDGRSIGEIDHERLRLGVQLVSFLPGRPAATGEPSPTARRALGAVVARLDRALAGFTHPLSNRSLLWDLTCLAQLRPHLDAVPAERRSLVARELDRFADYAPRLARLRRGTIHGDLNPANVLFDVADPERIVGIVDFGDMVHGPVVCDPAIAASYQAFGCEDPVAALVDVICGYHGVYALDPAEIGLVPLLAAARCAQSLLVSAWRVGIDPENAEYILCDADDSYETLGRLAEHDPAVTAHTLLRACGLERRLALTLDESLALRRARLGPALSLTYDTPVHLDSAEGVWLVDTDGNRLLDAYNNVPQVGHGHPRVTAALAGQARRLTTNTRYLVDEVAVYADRLAGLLPGELSVVMFVNSGSEANDVAIQIARAVTGNVGVVITEHAYHGTTAATAALSPEEFAGRPLEPWVATVGGAETLAAADAATRVAPELEGAFERLRGTGLAPAMVLFDSVFASDGIFRVPPGYLQAAYASARTAGALCVADEVQAGFGRVGAPFWGFAQDGVVPDIVTLGKPMGNGHPMGAVVTTPEIAAEFAARWHFFSTFAGSPVAAAVGSAVLDVIEDERLDHHAEIVGAYLRARLEERLGERAAVRGPGLFVGVELDDAVTARGVVERMRARGVLVGRTGARQNVVKIRPPLVFSERHADRVVDTLAASLETPREMPR